MQHVVAEPLNNLLPARPVGVRDIPLALAAPRRFFARVEDVPRYGWPLLILLTAVTLIGYAIVETGLIDRQVNQRTVERIAALEQAQLDVVERSALREMYEKQYKRGEFDRLMSRLQVVISEPLRILATVMVIAAVLYGAVALTGRKPEWHTLMNICVFAAFVELARLLFQFGMMVHFQTLDVETSLAMLLRPVLGAEGTDPRALAAAWGLLTALDPFRIWFWLTIVAGLTVTSQLPGWRAWALCGGCWLVGAVVRAGLLTAAIAQSAPSPTPGVTVS